jgi:hypothetical protein
MTIDYYVQGITYNIIVSHPGMLMQPINWILLLLVGGFVGLAYRTHFYTYYLTVTFPLQIFAIEIHHLSSSYLHGDLPIVVIIVSISLASSVFLGKILPRKKIWIF